MQVGSCQSSTSSSVVISNAKFDPKFELENIKYLTPYVTGGPVVSSGARCISTLLNEMKRRGRDCRFGVVTMCIG
jgi:hypothetical protein